MTAYHTILVDTDGSDRSYRVVGHAAELAHASHARLLILCARHDIDPHTLGPDLDRLGPDAYQIRGTTPTDAILRIAHRHATTHGATDIATHILAPPTLHALLHLAATTGADLIVTGHPHRHPLLARWPSTVPVELARKAHCDVLIVHTPPDNPPHLSLDHSHRHSASVR
ncbi:universal stress protein [Nocardia puris]|uniref:universal stress protein n=1 Tax=Nocardia puris TaxID=208602 RepID=UPI0018958401|nr:universal stress protein [Nocardia puris]MBF6214784.1 universal stress protein [Nocardia puris]